MEKLLIEMVGEEVEFMLNVDMLRPSSSTHAGMESKRNESFLERRFSGNLRNDLSSKCEDFS